ncbi:MAG: hypothetical protein PUC59_05905 [Firmicutes bacterium]|nr:hypothetical protein [Bacillota bacterium]
MLPTPFPLQAEERIYYTRAAEILQSQRKAYDLQTAQKYQNNSVQFIDRALAELKKI